MKKFVILWLVKLIKSYRFSYYFEISYIKWLLVSFSGVKRLESSSKSNRKIIDVCDYKQNENKDIKVIISIIN